MFFQDMQGALGKVRTCTSFVRWKHAGSGNQKNTMSARCSAQISPFSSIRDSLEGRYTFIPFVDKMLGIKHKASCLRSHSKLLSQDLD